MSGKEHVRTKKHVRKERKIGGITVEGIIVEESSQITNSLCNIFFIIPYAYLFHKLNSILFHKLNSICTSTIYISTFSSLQPTTTSTKTQPNTYYEFLVSLIVWGVKG